MLIAKAKIICNSRLYDVGAVLPDSPLKEAWLKNGVAYELEAKAKEVKQEEPEAPKPEVPVSKKANKREK